jgi:uncharacterized membrane protein YfcA
MMTEIILLVAGFLGGAVNSLAGGGSFIVFPALLFVGVPPVLANASNTYAALPGYASGVAGYWQTMKVYRGQMLAFGIVAILGGYIGAELLLVVSDAQFEMVVPWLMTFAVALFAFGNRFNAFIKSRSGGTTRMAKLGAALILVLMGLVCVYGGFFNAGLGILLLAALAMAGLTNIHAMNGLKLYISTLVALVAVIRFALNGSIDWYHGSIALIGVTTGGYLAARMAQHIPAQWIRNGVIIYGVFMTAYFFWAAYG